MRTQALLWLIGLLLGGIGLSNCNREVAPALVAEHIVQITPVLSGTLSVQDMNGRVRTTIQRSENFFLVFRLHNTGDSSLLTGPRPIYEPANNFYRDLVYDGNFFSLSRIMGISPVGEYVGKPFATYSHPDYVPGSITVPARTVAEWRVPWQGQVGDTYRLPVFTPTTTGGVQRAYGRYAPQPGTLSPGFYRSGFSLDVGDRRAFFLITFQAE